MTDFSQWWWQAAGVDPGPGPGPGPDPGDPIGQSLRFRGGQILERTSTTDGNRTTWTWSTWIKKTFESIDGTILLRSDNGAQSEVFRTDQNDRFEWLGSAGSFRPPNQFRDSSAWYHIVVAFDSTQATAANRIRFYLNGVKQPFASYTAPSKDAEGAIGGAGTYNIGGNSAITTLRWEGYLAAVYLVDGQALDPTTFGRFNSQGVWVPVDPQGLTYGSNGFKLLFEDPSDLGKDYSGNGNDFTATGFETADTSSSDYDLMLDSPTQNWATLNPIAIDYPAYFPKTKKANLAGDTSGAEADLAMFDTIALPPGKWYYEATFVTDLYLGIAEVFNKTNNRVAFVAKTGTIVREGTFTDSTESTTIGILGSGTLCCKVDTEAREIAYSIDGNVWDTTTYLEPKSSALYAYFSAGIIQPSSGSLSINFGQQPFIHTPPTGFKALQTQNMPAAPIPNGREHFQVLTGLGGEYYGNAIFTDNVNVSQSATPNTATTEFKGSNRGGCVSGGLGTRTLSGDPPGSWIVFRPDAPFENVTSLRIRVEHNYLGAAWVNDSPVDLSGKLNPGTTDWVDITPDVTPFTLRNFADKGTSSPAAQGTLYAIEINGVVLSGGLLEAAQATFPNSLIWIKDRANSNQHQLVDSVRTNGFAIQTPSLGAAVAYVAPAGSSVAWCWNAPEAFTSTDGSIASAGMRNVDAGFSIIEYTGNSIAGATVGHGLSRAPEFMLVRDYAASNKLHYCYSEEIGNESYMYLQGSVPAGANSNIYWNSTSPTDTVFTLGVDANINAGGSQVICYAWHSVPNYSAFGSYQGNSDPNGPFIYTGFRPAFVLYKCSTTTGNWSIRDSIRNTANPANAALFPNQSRDELVNSGNDVDLLSNGFKLRDNDIIQNGTGSYVYAAFAENPFQSPATAR